MQQLLRHPIHEGMEGGGVASAHLATRFGYALKASNISQLKEFAGEVFNMAGSICCRLCVLLVCLWGVAADQTHQCHHSLSWGTITSWNNTNSRVQRPDMKRWHAYQEFWMHFCVWACVCATLRQTALQGWRMEENKFYIRCRKRGI